MTNSKQKCLRPVTRQAVHHAVPVHRTVHHAALVVHHTAHHSVAHHDVVTKDITITECEVKVENKCFNVAKFVDATNTVDQKEIIIGEPNCDEVTLSLPTQSCTKSHGYHG